MAFTLNESPKVLVLSTDTGPVISTPDVGFLYSKLIFLVYDKYLIFYIILFFFN